MSAINIGCIRRNNHHIDGDVRAFWKHILNLLRVFSTFFEALLNNGMVTGPCDTSYKLT